MKTLALSTLVLAFAACGGSSSHSGPTWAEEPSQEQTLDFAAAWIWQDMPASRARFEGMLSHPLAVGDADVRAEVLTQIARTHGIERDFDRARVRLAEAETIAPPGGRAEVRIALETGRVLNTSGDPAGARPHFERAAELAAARGDVDGLYVDALHMIAIVSPRAEELEWNLRAIAYADASSDPAARNWLGSLLNNVAWTYFEMGDYESALAHHQRGLAWRQERGQQGDPLWIAEWAVGRMLRALGRNEEALEIQTRVEAARAAADSPDGYVYEELGELALSAGDEAGARAHFARAWELLSRDSWFVENEAERAARIREFGAGE